MNDTNPRELARRHPFVRQFASAQADMLAGLAREVAWAKDQVIYREGEAAPDFYLIESGTIALEVDPPTGPVQVDTLTAGEEFGWAAVLSGPRVLQARAMEATRPLAFEGPPPKALCETDPTFGYAFMRVLLASSQERLQALRLQLMDSRWPVAARAGA